MDYSRQTEARASEWLLRRESAGWSDADRARLEQWLNDSVLNRVAFLRLEAGWQQVNRIKALGAGFPPRSVPGVVELARAADEASGLREPEDDVVGIDESPEAPGSRSVVGASRGGGAGWGRRGLAALAAGVLIVLSGTLSVSVGPWAGTRYATPVGGVSSVPLSDGSSVTLNTSSRIRVRMSDSERRVDLTQGEVYFDVAPDPARPFVVQAGVQRIVVLGTKFSVRLDDDDVRIVVTEGKISVGSTEGGSSAVEHLQAGAVATATTDAVDAHTRTPAESEELLSWRYGFVVFHETTLADAVAEFERYDDRDIVVRDPTIAGIHLTGKFRANNLDAFVRLLESTSPVRAEYEPGRIVLTSTQGAARRP
jgi:transmembrane sensor